MGDDVLATQGARAGINNHDVYYVEPEYFDPRTLGVKMYHASRNISLHVIYKIIVLLITSYIEIKWPPNPCNVLTIDTLILPLRKPRAYTCSTSADINDLAQNCGKITRYNVCRNNSVHMTQNRSVWFWGTFGDWYDEGFPWRWPHVAVTGPRWW